MSPLILTLAALLSLGSLGTCAFLAVRAMRGQPWPPPCAVGPPTWPGWLFPASFFAWLGFSMALGKPLPKMPTGPDAINAVVLHNALVRAGVFIFVVGLIEIAQSRMSTDMSDAPRIPIIQQLRFGAVGFLASLAPTFVVFKLTEPLRTDADLHPLLQLIEQDSTRHVLISIVCSAVLVAPFTEELLFRVVLQRSLLRYMPPRTAILTTAMAFCAIHIGSSWLDPVCLLPLSLVLGVFYHRTGSFVAAVFIHLLFNAYNIISLLAESGVRA